MKSIKIILPILHILCSSRNTFHIKLGEEQMMGEITFVSPEMVELDNKTYAWQPTKKEIND